MGLWVLFQKEIRISRLIMTFSDAGIVSPSGVRLWPCADIVHSTVTRAGTPVLGIRVRFKTKRGTPRPSKIGVSITWSKLRNVFSRTNQFTLIAFWHVGLIIVIVRNFLYILYGHPLQHLSSTLRRDHSREHIRKCVFTCIETGFVTFSLVRRVSTHVRCHIWSS